MRETFSAGEASHLTGVPYRTLDHWARTRFIAPSSSDAQGRGSERRYTFKDLIALRAAKELRDGGVSTKKLQRAIRFLRRKGNPDDLLSRLVVVGSDVVLVSNCRELTSLLNKPGQGVFAFMLDLKRTVSEVREKVAQLHAA